MWKREREVRIVLTDMRAMAATSLLLKSYCRRSRMYIEPREGRVVDSQQGARGREDGRNSARWNLEMKE